MDTKAIIAVDGHPVALSHEHRGGIAPDPGKLRPAPDLLERAGGTQVVEHLIDSFYARIEDDSELARVFPHFETGTIKAFFIEWLGGERSYSRSYRPSKGLDRFHRGVCITRGLAARWLHHLRTALDDSPIAPAAADEIINGMAPIATALVNSDDAVLRNCELVASCSSVQTTEFLRRDGLRSAAARGQTSLIRRAIEAEPDLVHMRGSDGRTLIWEAASRGRSELVEYLLAHGADPNLPGCDPATINLACSSSARLGTAVMVTPQALARARGHRNTEELLHSRGALMDIFSAAYVGDVAVLNALLDVQPSLISAEDPAEDFNRITPLHHAVGGGQIETTAFLIARGLPVEPDSTWLLTHAALQNRADIIELLLVNGADARKSSVIGPLDKPERPVADLLIAHGHDINDNPAYGPMLVRACRGDVSQNGISRVEALLSYGADVNRPDQRTLTALHYAVRAGNLAVIRLLLEHGADVRQRDREGLSPLGHLKKTRAKAEPIPVLELMISHGADIDSQDESGETLLFYYARRCDFRLVKWLIENGAARSVRNRAGKTAAEVVRKSQAGAADVSALLG